MADTQSNVQRNFGQVTVDSVELHTVNENKAKQGIMNVQVRQTVETVYPSVNIKSGGLFDIDQFDVAGQSYTSTRVTWFDAPAGTTVEQVQALLANKPDARIVARYSNNLDDVLTDAEKAVIAQKIQTREFFENKKRIKDGNGNELDGPAQYRDYQFMANGGVDVDLRTFKGTGSASEVNIRTEQEVAAAGGQKVI